MTEEKNTKKPVLADDSGVAKEENIEKLKKQLEECEKIKAEYLAGWQRERADFLNYKKEEMERINQLMNYAKEEVILKILPVLDNFDVATRQNFLKENLDGQGKERTEKIMQGVNQIKKQIDDFLKSLGVEEIKTLGETFDPKFHEVAEEVESSSAKDFEGKEIKSGIIAGESQKGYKINGRLMRPAQVKVVK